LESEAEIKRF